VSKRVNDKWHYKPSTGASKESGVDSTPFEEYNPWLRVLCTAGDTEPYKHASGGGCSLD